VARFSFWFGLITGFLNPLAQLTTANFFGKDLADRTPYSSGPPRRRTHRPRNRLFAWDIRKVLGIP
jgi:hypothetical protein